MNTRIFPLYLHVESTKLYIILNLLWDSNPKSCWDFFLYSTDFKVEGSLPFLNNQTQEKGSYIWLSFWKFFSSLHFGTVYVQRLFTRLKIDTYCLRINFFNYNVATVFADPNCFNHNTKKVNEDLSPDKNW